MKLIDKETGEYIKHDSLIEWHCWDNDDFTLWTFRGIYKDYASLNPPFNRSGKEPYVIYLGGGIDFGSAIGQTKSVDEVYKESEDNDPDQQGVIVIGDVRDVLGAIHNISKEQV